MAWGLWIGVLGFLDMLDNRGNPSFSKLMCVAVLGISAATNTFGLGIAVACIAGAYGRSAFMAFLQSRKSE